MRLGIALRRRRYKTAERHEILESFLSSIVAKQSLETATNQMPAADRLPSLFQQPAANLSQLPGEIWLNIVSRTQPVPCCGDGFGTNSIQHDEWDLTTLRQTTQTFASLSRTSKLLHRAASHLLYNRVVVSTADQLLALLSCILVNPTIGERIEQFCCVLPADVSCRFIPLLRTGNGRIDFAAYGCFHHVVPIPFSDDVRFPGSATNGTNMFLLMEALAALVWLMPNLDALYCPVPCMQSLYGQHRAMKVFTNTWTRLDSGPQVQRRLRFVWLWPHAPRESQLPCTVGPDFGRVLMPASATEEQGMEWMRHLGYGLDGLSDIQHLRMSQGAVSGHDIFLIGTCFPHLRSLSVSLEPYGWSEPNGQLPRGKNMTGSVSEQPLQGIPLALGLIEGTLERLHLQAEGFATADCSHRLPDLSTFLRLSHLSVDVPLIMPERELMGGRELDEYLPPNLATLHLRYTLPISPRSDSRLDAFLLMLLRFAQHGVHRCLHLCDVSVSFLDTLVDERYASIFDEIEQECSNGDEGVVEFSFEVQYAPDGVTKAA